MTVITPAIIPSSGSHTAPEVSVVILNYNGKHFLKVFLPVLLQSTYPNMRVIVADNASTDNSVVWIKENYSQTELIILEKNWGFAAGYNEALKQIHSDYYVLLNSDVEVTSNWIEPVIALMEKNKNIAACQPKILSFNQRSYFEYAGAAGGWIDRYGYPFARGRVFDFCEEDTGQYNDAAPCFWASGAALFIRSEDFHSHGGFDPFFFAHQEEIDLCWRIQRSGKQIYCEPKSVVYHVGGGTLPKGNKQKIFLNFRNNLVMLHKNLPVGERFVKISLRLCLDGIAGVKMLFGGDVNAIPAILKAHWGYYKWLLGKRNPHPKPTKKQELTGKYNGSLIWQHFICRKKTFKEIVHYKQ